MLWKRANTTKRHYAFGFTKGRRREQAILAANTIKWRLRVLGRDHAQSMHDVANAFPSLSHKALYIMIDEKVHIDDRRFIKARHKKCVMKITTTGQEALYLRPGQGGLQGDGAMAPEFGQVYEAHITQWMDNANNPILATDPLTNQVLHVGAHCYADDISDINLLDNGHNTLEHVSGRRNEELDTILQNLEMGQNHDKEVHITTFIGRDSVKRAQNTRKIGEEKRNKKEPFGTIKKEDKYLGNYTEAYG
ncbi:MAG: hypothetical protein GY915_06220, partial [bacterium]|nr:hypothetical protein [bacterium]